VRFFARIRTLLGIAELTLLEVRRMSQKLDELKLQVDRVDSGVDLLISKTQPATGVTTDEEMQPVIDRVKGIADKIDAANQPPAPPPAQ